MQHDRIAEKLKKIKALADRGVGGEKETAMRMYEELKARYEIEDEEIMLDTVSLHWFGYNGELEEDLLTQIFYKVTGSASYHVYTGKYKRRKKRGCDCTEIEAAEIKLLFRFYKEELKRELKTFMIAFRSGNNLYPDETARCYTESDNIPERERTAEEKKRTEKGGILQNVSGQKGTATGNDWRRAGGRRMSKAAESYRELERALREAADKAATCAEVEEKENPTQEEREEAEKNFMWALMKIQAME